MIVQIYEIQTPAEARTMVQLAVDHVGSVVLNAPPRLDSELQKAVATVQAAGRKSSLIPLFSDVAEISETVRYYRPDILHLCETLPWDEADNRAVLSAAERQRALKSRFPGLEIMRSIPIATPGHADRRVVLKLAALFEPVSDWFLTDTLLSAGPDGTATDQPVNGFIGITGLSCDWNAARALVQASRIPVVLAGGIGPLNASDAIREVQPAGIDSCTLTNALDADGRPIRFKKDLEKVKAMVAAAHAASAVRGEGRRDRRI